MAGLPFWDAPSIYIPGGERQLDSPSANDAFWIGLTPPFRLPGLAKVSGKKGRRLDKKSSPGQDGATVTHLGYDPAEVLVRLTIWTPAHLEAWASVLPLLQPTSAKGAPRKFPVDHWKLALQGIRELYVRDIGLPEEGEPFGSMHITITLTEDRPGEKKNVTTTNAPSLLTIKTAFGSAPATPTPPRPSKTPGP